MKYRKTPIGFLFSITGTIGLMTILSSCGTRPPDETSKQAPEGIQGTIQRAVERASGQRRQSGTVIYKGPIEQSVPAGSFLSGTPIEYVGSTEDGTAQVLIDGQRAFKRGGDSLDWTGTPVEGVTVNLSDRVLWFTQDRLQLVGTIRLTVDNVAPQRSPIPQNSKESTSNEIVYKVPVIYRVKRGETIPGTTLTYLGNTDKGAQLGGLPQDEYPYRQAGDSIVWQGQLRSGVYLDLPMRTAVYDDNNLNVTGLATIILATGNATPTTP
jgi:hypothetical protein